MDSLKQKIVVIGGGFAGLNLVKHIDKSKYEVVLVDRHNYHSFPPLFYQIASSGLDASSICFPLRRELYKMRRKGQVHFSLGTVKMIDVTRKEVVTDHETIRYDKVVIALGTTNNFFNMPELMKSVYTLKSTPQALRTRNEIIDRLERAAIARNEAERRRLLSFVVVGGGPTGVETAGALGELKRYVLPREYPRINQEDMRIILLEGAPTLLGAMSPGAQEAAARYLEHLMVEVRTGVSMQGYEDGNIKLSDGSTIFSSTVIWTAGVTGEPLRIEGADLKRGRGNRFIVDGCNAVVGLKDVYAIGDIALMPDADPGFPQGHPQLAQVAIQQAHLLAQNLSKYQSKTFVYRDKGTMATVGRNRAVADLGKLHFKGFPAWFMWMFVHLISILGMRNKITVLINWIWAYFSYQTSLRLLIRPDRYPLRQQWRE